MLLVLLMHRPTAPRTGNDLRVVANAAGSQVVLPPAPPRGQPLFIRLAEATRHWLGPKPVALFENGWYSLADLV